ncbi:MAG: GNAT family N-acetyltransferase [Clostridia bacterium]|nr:GNAT family N-acetyltransferase [Clostridia bacterium]
MLIFKDITKDNYKQCLNLSVHKNQINFVGSNASSLAKAYVFKDETKPFSIYDNDNMIGFLLMRFNFDIDNCFLWEFMIDKNYQSQGYGKKSLILFIDWVKNNTSFKTITTTCKLDNIIAKNLYTDLGFKYLSSCLEFNEENLILNIR